MVKVCQLEYPLTESPNDKRREPGFYLHENLKTQIDFYLKNVIYDWDFTIIIGGEGEVRVGKSMLAMQIGRYWTSELKRLYNIDVPFNVKENFIFNGRELIKKGNALALKMQTKYNSQKIPCGAIVYDEASDDLDSSKSMHNATQATKAYLKECGQYNMLNIIVLPEFFDLPKGVALTRSACLINVYYIPDEEGIFKRGYFKFYSKPQKKWLYILGKKTLDYNAAKSDFYGDFDEFYTIDEQEYRTAKIKALKDREKLSQREERRKEALKGCFRFIHETGLTFLEIATKVNERSGIKISPMYISRLLGGEKDVDEEEATEV